MVPLFLFFFVFWASTPWLLRTLFFVFFVVCLLRRCFFSMPNLKKDFEIQKVFTPFLCFIMPRSKNVSRRKARKAVRKTSKSSPFNYARKDQRAVRSQFGVKDVLVTAPGSALEFRAPRMYLKGGPFQQSILTKLRYCESFVMATNNITGLSETPVRYPVLAVSSILPSRRVAISRTASTNWLRCGNRTLCTVCVCSSRQTRPT